MKVVVFPSNNEPGLEVVEALSRHPRIDVWCGTSVDLQSDPSRFLLPDKHLKIPPLGSTDFRKELIRLSTEIGADAIFPTVDAIVAEMAGWETDLKIIAPEKWLAELVLSKSRLYAAVGQAVPIPREFDSGSMSFPAFAKPDIGSGSRGIMKINNEDEYGAAKAAGLLLQEFLPGREFTVDCVSDAQGQLLACSVRQRLAYSNGIARASICVDHLEIEAFVRRIGEILPFAGPWFAQFREDHGGLPRLMEANARIAGSSGVTRLAGINTPLIAVLAFSGVDVKSPIRRPVGTVLRRLDLNGDVDDFDWVIWDLDDTLVHAGEVVDAEMVSWLFRFRQAGKLQSLVTRNKDPNALLARTGIPEFFDTIERTSDKLETVNKLKSDRKILDERIIMINDSGAEKLTFEHRFPGIRTITPDAINILRK